MTGEGDFTLPESERESLRRYVQRGGFLLASASCSSSERDRAFRRVGRRFSRPSLAAAGHGSSRFHTVYDIKELYSHDGTPQPSGHYDRRSRGGDLLQDGLNDTAHTQGCCCCGGNEINNCERVNANILAYALTY